MKYKNTKHTKKKYRQKHETYGKNETRNTKNYPKKFSKIKYKNPKYTKIGREKNKVQKLPVKKLGKSN